AQSRALAVSGSSGRCSAALGGRSAGERGVGRRRGATSLFPYTPLFRSPAERNVIGSGESLEPLLETGMAAFLYPSRPLPILLTRSEEHTSELQSRFDLVCRRLLEKKRARRRPPWRAGRWRPSSSQTQCA